MQLRRVGPSGLEVGRLALAATGWGRELDAETCADLLGTFREAGGTLLVASPGTSEEILGTLIGATHGREDMVLCSSTPPGALGRKQVLDDLDAALDRLRTDRLDLWLLDGADPRTPIEETLQAVDLAVASGRVRYAGVTGMAPWRVAAAATWQRALPGQRTPLVASFTELSLVSRRADDEMLPACADLGLGVLAGAPLGYGVLTGKYRAGTPRDARMAAPLWADILAPYLPLEGVVDAVLTAADGLGVAPVAVALAWVRDHPGVVAPVVGVRTKGQLVAALTSERVVLPEQIRSALGEVSVAAIYE